MYSILKCHVDKITLLLIIVYCEKPTNPDDIKTNFNLNITLAQRNISLILLARIKFLRNHIIFTFIFILQY